MKSFKLLLIVVAGLLQVGTLGLASQDKATPTSEAQSDKASGQQAVASRTGEQIKWQVISSGGTDGSSTNFQLAGTVAQTAVGTGSSPNFQLSHGYWQELAGGGTSCCVLRADINHDGLGPDIADLVYLVSYMFQSGPTPPCEEPMGSGYCPEADVDGNLVGPDISDLVYLVSFMFQNGPAPVPCP